MLLNGFSLFVGNASKLGSKNELILCKNEGIIFIKHFFIKFTNLSTIVIFLSIQHYFLSKAKSNS